MALKQSTPTPEPEFEFKEMMRSVEQTMRSKEFANKQAIVHWNEAVKNHYPKVEKYAQLLKSDLLLLHEFGHEIPSAPEYIDSQTCVFILDGKRDYKERPSFAHVANPNDVVRERNGNLKNSIMFITLTGTYIIAIFDGRPVLLGTCKEDPGTQGEIWQRIRPKDRLKIQENWRNLRGN